MNRPGISFLIILIWMQTFILLFYCSRLFSLKFSIKHKFACFLICDTMICIVIFLMCKYVCDSHMAFSFFYTLILQVTLCLFLFSGNAYSKVLYILFTNILYNMILLLSIAVASLLFPYINNYISLYQLKILANIVFEFIAFFILWPLMRFAVKSPIYIYLSSFSWYAAYLVFFLLYFGIVYVADLSSTLNAITPFTLLFELGLLVICIFTYITFTLLCQSYQEKIQHVLAQKQYEIQKKHLQETVQINDDVRKLRHELKNTVFYMNYLINKKDYEELLQYFRTFYDKEYHTLIETSSSDSIIEATLHQKINLAKESGITVESHFSPYSAASISEWDLCILLSNLLDYAIEACCDLPNSQIQIQIKPVKQYLSIAIANTVSYNILQKNPKLSSTKKQKKIHGIGTKVVHEIILKYNGSIHFESSSTLFTVQLMLDTNPSGRTL